MSAVREVLHQNTVLDLGPLPAPRLQQNATVGQALQFLVRGRRGAIVVVDDLRPVGVFTERDVVKNLIDGPLGTSEEGKRTPLSEAMSQPPVTIRRQASLAEAVTTMVTRQYRHLVVVDRAGLLRGLLTSRDIIQFLTDHFPEDTVNLPPRLRQQYRSPGGA